jgi:hypothetical protein
MRWETWSFKKGFFWWTVICVVLIWIPILLLTSSARGETVQPLQAQVTYQGKTAQWWAKRAVQARKDANARGHTIKRLKTVVSHDLSVQESIKLATMVYPAFTEHRAWCIIHHESWMTRDPLHAKNPSSTATGLYQFLTSTFRSTPYGHLSIYSPYAQSLAAGWMHQHGRGGEWAISC